MPASLMQAISRFFRWWGGELAACLPESLRERLGRSRHRLLIEMSSGSVRFSHGKGRSLEPIGEISISEADLAGQRSAGQAKAVSRLLGKTQLRTAEVVLSLPRDKVLRRMVDLPSAAAENLREVLGFEMDRHTPFKAGEVYYDYRLEASDPARGQIRVDLVVVPRSVADHAMRLAESWGLEPDQLAVGEAEEGGGRSFDLLPGLGVRQAARSGRRLSAGLAVAAGILLVAALYLPLRQKQEVLALTEGRLAEIRTQAIEAGDLNKQVEALLERSRFVISRRGRDRTAIELLDEITRVLPDHTWILKFGLRQAKVTLSGYSAKPTALIGLLEQSEMLQEVRFSSPVTMDRKIGLERFNLTAAVKERQPQ